MNFPAGSRPAGAPSSFFAHGIGVRRLQAFVATLPATIPLAIIAFAVIALATVAGVGRAAAQAVDCGRLAAQINSLGSGRGSPHAAASARRQEAEIRRLNAHARALGCNRPHFLFFDDRPAQCDNINARISGMRANLAQLQQAALGSDGMRRRLQEQYDAYCRNSGGSNFLERLFGGQDQVVYPPADPGPEGRESDGMQDAGARGGSEAVCVRTCDGYFFPISYSARRANLNGLQDMCSALCPATETKLYTRAPSNMKSALSINGDPYTSLENAFKYEKTLVPDCSCRKPGQSWSEALVGAEQLLGEGRKGDIMVTPEKAEELSRAPHEGQPAVSKGQDKSKSEDKSKSQAKSKASAFDPKAMKQFLEERKQDADGGDDAPTATRRR
ncbi:MAG: DUF2865 domain-containing protein [Rhodoblastus sp.]